MYSHHPARRRPATVVMALVGVILAIALAACGSSSPNSGGSSSASSSGSAASGATTGASAATTGASGATTAATTSAGSAADASLLIHALYTSNVPNPSPILIQALHTAATPLTAAQQKLLATCMKNTTCETGQGKLVLGIADSFGDIPWRIQARVELTAQAIQSGKVSKIIYTDGHGNLQQSESNFRSLMAQHVNVISAYYDFASAMTSLFRQAQAQGVIVTSYISTIPNGNGPHAGIQFAANLNTVAQEMATATERAHPAPGNAALFTGVPGNPTGGVWEPIVTKALEAKGWKVVYQGNTAWTPAGELSAASAAISKNKHIDAILYDGAGPLDLMKGFQRAGVKMPAVISWGSGNTYFQFWKQLGSPANEYITNGQTWTGRVALQAGIDRASGQSVPGNIELPEPLVQAKQAEPYWTQTLSYGPAYLPPTFAGSLITQFSK